MNLPESLWHQEVQSLTDEHCEGELTPEDIYKWGYLVNRVWTCDECGSSFLEPELEKEIELYIES